MAGRIPKLCHHRATGRGYVTDPRTKKEHYFRAPYGTADCVGEYREWVARLEAARGGCLPPPGPARPVTVAALVADYLAHCKAYYRKHGRRTTEVLTVGQALRPLLEVFGATPAADFGPADLKAVRSAYVALGWAREHVNEQAGRVRRMFRWAVEQELVPATVLVALRAVAPLKRGRTPARETEPVGPVAREVVWATLPHLAPPLAALVRCHWYSGCRAEDAVVMRPCDLGAVQADGLRLYLPYTHKTEHLGHTHHVWLNGPAQEALAALLTAAEDPSAWLFPSRGRGRSHRYRGHLTVSGYRQAVAAACAAHGIPHWFPLQVRHAFLTAARDRLGLEAAQALAGHRHASTTEIYARTTESLARRAALEMASEGDAPPPGLAAL